MRKIFLLVFTCYFFAAKAQLNFEFAYPEKELQTKLQLAKTPAEQIRATGILAIHYRIEFNDSLAAAYINKVLQIAKNTNDINLTATALWWDAISSAAANCYDETQQSIIKANKLLQYAENHHLVKDQITASLLLNGINIHNDLVISEQYAFNAKQLLDNWKTDSTQKDSVKLEVYQSLAHVFVHKMDGVNAARYLLAQQDYAEQNRNEPLKLQAMANLSAMYGEWPGQTQRAIQWSLKLYDYFKKTKQANNQLLFTFSLMGSYSTLGKKDSATYYLKESEKLQDSLKASDLFLLYHLSSKINLELITPSQAMEVFNSHFNNRLFLPPALTDLNKASIFLQHANLDSAGFYLTKAKKNKVDSLSKNWNSYNDLMVNFYLENKEYDKAIVLLREIQKGNEKVGNRSLIESVPKNLYEAYKGKKDYKRADEYLTRYHYLKDSLDDLNNKEEVALMEMQKLKEIQDASMKEQAGLQQAEAEKIAFQNKVRLYSLLAGLGILLLIAAILWRNSINKQKANALLHQQKNKVEAALSELKSTQAQLIHSEKMASLGELTAGIAHEIQNPLNFMNNFSEVNGELIEELLSEKSKEKSERDDALEIELLQDLKENEQKINHHGKRADAIVKGMLQHSRTSTGVKEPTDINKLADEYLRLAYHGLRAKDKTFNATMKTDFDESIGNINIIPQDIGRVILNLINNAFYAVAEKSSYTKASEDKKNYEPTVSLSTKKVNGKVEIVVADNGNGIPQNIVDKIFQPFFTTKPTGQGTGLGLSLSYDIIKAHGGEIKVETKQGEGSEFMIQLPLIDLA